MQSFNLDPSWARRAWWLYAAAVASSLPTLGFYLVGEEGILVNSSLEMWQRGDWLRLWMYGVDAKHGVFANWLVILLCNAIGWEHAPAATRVIMIASTAVGALTAAYLAKRIYRNAVVAAMVAAVAVTFADIVLYRGWLGYRDPLLGMLVFGAMAAMWLAVIERRMLWLIATVLFTAAAFLTKGIIAYAFVGAAVLVFLCQRESRVFLLRPAPLLLAVATLSVPFVWAYVVGGDQSHNNRLTAEILDKLAPLGGLSYLKTLITYPMETVLRLAPVSFLVGWWLYQRRMVSEVSVAREIVTEPAMRTALLISIIAYVPFWLAPQSHFRYVFPLLPLLAVVLAVTVCRLGEAYVRTTFRWLWALVAIKVVLAVGAFPFYQHTVRGENYAQTAQVVVQRTAGFPLYSNDTTAAGLSVTAYMNILRLPQRALTFAPPAGEWESGFTVSYSPNAPDLRGARIFAQYPLAGDTLYLYCKGAACAAPPQ